MASSATKHTGTESETSRPSTAVAAPTRDASPGGKPEKLAPGAKWNQLEQHHIPENRLGIVFFGLALSVFLAAMGEYFNFSDERGNGD
jgi:hypothetical protein